MKLARAVLVDALEQRDVLRGLGLPAAAVLESAAGALGPAGGLVGAWVGRAHAEVLAQRLEDGLLPFVRHGHDVVVAGMDLELGRALADEALVEEAVDLELHGDAPVPRREHVAGELGVADPVAAAGSVADQEVGLADELERFAVEAELDAEARLVDRGGAVADRLESQAFALGLVRSGEVDETGECVAVGLLVEAPEVPKELCERGVRVLLLLAASAQGHPPLALGRLVVIVDVGGGEAHGETPPCQGGLWHSGWDRWGPGGIAGQRRRYTSPRWPIVTTSTSRTASDTRYTIR